MMKSKFAKSISLILCGTMLIGISIGATAYAANTEKITNQEESNVETTPSVKEEAGLIKDETVYVLAGTDGSVQKIIVSDWIKNSLQSETISDKSQLTDIENVKGNETYTLNGDTMRIWDAQGNDIYYQGNIEKELPVGIQVTYRLDGKNISAEELAGKSGKVTIRFDYTNHQYETVSIDGKKEKIYVPFAMVTGLLLDTDIFTNVEVSNGKLINDGNHMAVMGIAFPGLQENLNISRDTLTIPDYVEISADVKNFEMTNTVTIATNAIFSKLQTEKLDSLEDLTDSLGELTEAMNQLMDGSSRLYDGLCTLLDRSGELIRGIDQLAEGAQKLQAGGQEIDAGVGALCIGSQQLADGLGQLTANNQELNAGAKQVFDSLLNMADTQLASAGLTIPSLTVDNYDSVLNGIIESLDEKNVAVQAQEAAKEKVTNAVETQRDTVKEAVKAGVQKEVEAKVTAVISETVEAKVLETAGMTKEQYEAAIQAGIIPEEQQTQIQMAIDTQMQSETVKGRIAANVQEQMQSENIQQLIQGKTEEQIGILIEQNMNSPEVQAQITAALEKAKSAAAGVSALKGQLDSYHRFYSGLQEYTAGVASAKEGAEALQGGTERLKAGTEEWNAGITQLYNGILTLKEGAPALTNGVAQLRDGAMQLSEGLAEFHEKGVQRLVDAVEGNISGFITRVKATVDAAKEYQSFSGIADSMEGQVKFIYRTESVEAEK